MLPSRLADKPCAFLLSPAEDSQGSDGKGSGAPVAGGGWSAICTTLTMAALACCGWVVCFGWPSVLKEKGVAHPPAVTAPVKMPKGGENDAHAADVANALPGTHGTPEATPSLELPSSALQEAGKEKDDAILGEKTVKEEAGESLNRGKAKDLEIPNGEVHGEEVSTAAESGEDTSAGELTSGESVSGEKEELLSSTPSIAIAVTAEMPKDESGDFSGANIAHAVPTAQEEPQTTVCDGEVACEELGPGEFPSVEEYGGEVGCCGGTMAPEQTNNGVDGVEVTAVGEERATGEVVEDGGVAPAGDARNGDVCNGGEVRDGMVAGLEVASEQLPLEEGPHGEVEAMAPLDPLFTFGDKPLI